MRRCTPQNPAYRFQEESSKDRKWYIQQPSCSNDTLKHDVHFFHSNMLKFWYIAAV